MCCELLEAKTYVLSYTVSNRSPAAVLGNEPAFKYENAFFRGGPELAAEIDPRISSVGVFIEKGLRSG